MAGAAPDAGVTPAPGPLSGTFGPAVPFAGLPPQGTPPVQAIQYDTVGPSPSAARATSGNLTWTHTTLLPNTGIIVFAALDTTVASSTMTATCDGNAMTSLAIVTGGDIQNCVAQAWMSNRGLASGAHAIVVTPTAGYTDIEGGSLSFGNYASHDQPAFTANAVSSASDICTCVVPNSTAGNPVCAFVAAGDSISAEPFSEKFVNTTTGLGGNQLGNISGSVLTTNGGTLVPQWTIASAGTTYASICVELMPPAPVHIVTAANQQAYTGVPYSLTLQAFGGYSPITWSVTSGSLPAWATLSAGVISGTPASTGTDTFTLTATDNAGATASIVMTISWAAKPFITGLSPGGGVNRWFTDQNSNPTVLMGMAAWGLIAGAGDANGTGTNTSDYTAYCQNAAAQGFNSLQINGLGHTHTGGLYDDGRDAAGNYPFLMNGTGGPFVTGTETVTLNNAYWSRVDTLIATAQTYGLAVMLNISLTCDMANGTNHGFTNGAWWHASTTQETTAAKLIAARYASSPNVMSGFMGDDYYNDDDTNMNAIRQGLAAGDPRTISLLFLEYYPNGTTSRYDISAAPSTETPFPVGIAYATLNHVYCYMQTYFGIEYAYNEPGPIPVYRGDGYYYTEGPTYPDDDRLSRWALWWALASAARGANFGNDPVNMLQAGWVTNIGPNSGEAFYTGHVPGNAFAAVMGLQNWWKLIPHTSSVFVTSGRGTRATYTVSEFFGASGSDNYVCACIAPDGTCALVYCAAAFSITIAQGKLGPGYTAYWIDPLSGQAYPATTGSSYNSALTDGTKPVLNSGGAADWVLAFQGPPASMPPPPALDPGPPQTGGIPLGIFGPAQPFGTQKLGTATAPPAPPAGTVPPGGLPRIPQLRPQRARAGRALVAAGIIGVTGLTGTTPSPGLPRIPHPAAQRAHAGPAGRNAAGITGGPNRGFAPPPQLLPRVPRLGPQRALWHGAAGPANHGTGVLPPGGLPRIPHPQPARALWRGQAGPANHSYAPPPAWHPQPRRPGPARALWRGQAGGPNQVLAFVAAGPPPWHPQPRRPGPSRAIGRGQAGPGNHGYASPPPALTHAWNVRKPLRGLWHGLTAPPPRPGPPAQQFTQPRRPPPQRALWRGGKGTTPAVAVPPPGLLRQPPRRFPYARAVWRYITGQVAPPPPAALLDPQFLAGTITPDNTAGTITADNYSGTITADNTAGTITQDNYSGTIAADNYAGTIA